MIGRLGKAGEDTKTAIGDRGYKWSVGAPIPHTATRPVNCREAGLAKPALRATNVAVISAPMAAPNGNPVSQSRPLGRSIANTSTPDSRAFATASTISGKFPRGGVVNPVPKIA